MFILLQLRLAYDGTIRYLMYLEIALQYLYIHFYVCTCIGFSIRVEQIPFQKLITWPIQESE